MAFGAPTGGQLSYSTVAPPAVQAAQAAAAAPQANADAAQKLAEAQAGKQTAQAQGVQADLAKQQAGDQILQRLAQTPGIEKSPMGLKMLTERFKTLGMELPKDETGAVDMKAVQAMITPPIKPWSQWTPAEKNAVAGEDPKLRSLPADAPDAARTMPANVPITEKGVDALMKPVQLAEAEIGKGRGNMQALQAAALSTYKALQSRGADTSVIDPYLNADHTALSDDFKGQAAGQLVDAQIGNLHSLGIFRADEASLKDKALAEKKREWGTASANVKAQQTTAGLRLQQQASQFSQSLSIKNQNLSARLQSISNSANANSLRAGTLGMNMFENQVKDAEKVQQDAENNLGKVQANINSYLNTPNADITNPIYTALAQQASDLNDTINGNAAKQITGSKAVLQAARASANSGIASIYSGITGQTAAPVTVNVTTPGAAPGTTYGSNTGGGQPMESKSKSGKPIVSTDGGATWHYK